MSGTQFDVVVIGSGPGGYVAAIRAAQLGLSVAVVEREHLGGICLNWGCIPTKALLRSAEVFHLMERAAEFGLGTTGVSFDLDAIVERSRKIAGQLSAGVAHLLKKNKVTVITGHGRITGPGQVQVDGDGDTQSLAAGAIIIATGARARDLPGLEADGKRVWSYKHALRPAHMPEKLLVIGSGAIGIEFASFFATLGAETTVVEVQDRVLPVEDADISAHARTRFEKQGMTILAPAMVQRLDRADASVTATVEAGGKTQTLTVDTVISAVGIQGNIEDIGLDTVGINTDRGHIVVDEHCRTGVAGIYAIGDVAGPPWLAHKASHEGVMVAEVIAGHAAHPVAADRIPGCTYSHPQVASVGLTEEAARAAGHDVAVGRFPFIGNGKAIALGEADGFVKTIFDRGTGALLGAHMIGAEVTELIQGYVIGQTLETTEADLMQTTFPHPTLSEMMHESVLAAFGREIHM